MSWSPECQIATRSAACPAVYEHEFAPRLRIPSGFGLWNFGRVSRVYSCEARCDANYGDGNDGADGSHHASGRVEFESAESDRGQCARGAWRQSREVPAYGVERDISLADLP